MRVGKITLNPYSTIKAQNQSGFNFNKNARFNAEMDTFTKSSLSFRGNEEEINKKEAIEELQDPKMQEILKEISNENNKETDEVSNYTSKICDIYNDTLGAWKHAHKRIIKMCMNKGAKNGYIQYQRPLRLYPPTMKVLYSDFDDNNVPKEISLLNSQDNFRTRCKYDIIDEKKKQYKVTEYEWLENGKCVKVESDIENNKLKNIKVSSESFDDVTEINTHDNGIISAITYSKEIGKCTNWLIMGKKDFTDEDIAAIFPDLAEDDREKKTYTLDKKDGKFKKQ